MTNMFSASLKYLDKDYVKYILCGAFNTSLCFIVYCAGIQSGISYIAANVIAWTIGLMVSFFLNARLVFKSSYHYKRFLLFALSNVLSLFVSTTILSILIKGFLIDPILASIIAIPCVVAINFTAAKFIVFRQSL